MTARGTWKNFERVIAEAWTNAIGLVCKRNILSGANNRTDSGNPRPGDIVIHSGFDADVLVEAKYRSTHAHHKLFRDAKADAAKHGLSQTLLYTRQKQEEGYLVVMDAALFHQMLAIPDVQKLFKKGPTTAGHPIPTTRQTTRQVKSKDENLSTDRGESPASQKGNPRKRRPAK